MSNRNKRKVLAEETLKIMESGHYLNSLGENISIKAQMEKAVKGSVLIRPEAWEGLLSEAKSRLTALENTEAVHLEVPAETTFAACRRLIEDEGQDKVFCLNFASAKNPGGGFLGGSQAQEEALARASGLYACLTENFEYYKANRARSTSLYSDYMIYTPDVPVFRDDADHLLDAPYNVSILTAPAVNAGAVRQNESSNVSKIDRTMRARTEKVLAYAFLKGYKTLVMGAWGCGVFRNEPSDIAGHFAHFLKEGGDYAHAFERVIFAIPDFKGSGENLKAFRAVFETAS